MTCSIMTIRSYMKPLHGLAALLLALFLVLWSPFSYSANALELGSPIPSRWVSGSISLEGYGLRSCWSWHNTGLSCGNDPTSNSKYLVDYLAFTADGNGSVVQGNSNYLISFSYTVKSANTESFIGLSSGPNFMILDQTLTQSGDQFHGSVIALTTSDSSGIFKFSSNTTYNQSTTFSILITRPIMSLVKNMNSTVSTATIEQYLTDIKWNGQETAKKLDSMLNLISLLKSDVSTIAWNSTETQKKLETIIAALGTSNTGNSQTNDLLNQQLEEDKKQTEQQQEQYDKEKQEEADRENSGKEDGNKLLGIFNFTLLNPFAGIWEMFNPGGCTSIPTISSWLHSEDTTYCSWWPQSIRATLTPVFSLASMMLLFGFVVRWLRGGNIDIDGGSYNG